MTNNPAQRRVVRQTNTREMILARAKQHLVAAGSESFSLRQLAADLGYSAGALYLYFPDKGALLDALVDHAFVQLSAALGAVEPSRSPVEVLERTLEAYIRWGLAHPDEYRFAFIRPRRTTAGTFKPHQAFDRMRELVGACRKLRGFQNIDVETTSQILWTAAHGLTAALISLPQFPWIDRDRLIAETIETLVAGVRTRSAASAKDGAHETRRTKPRK